jgi:hypothetical protein
MVGILHWGEHEESLWRWRVMTRRYPNISDILARKEEARREKSRWSFQRKVEVVERLRERVQSIRAARESQRKRETK